MCAFSNVLANEHVMVVSRMGQLIEDVEHHDSPTWITGWKNKIGIPVLRRSALFQSLHFLRSRNYLERPSSDACG